ncbi:Omp28-related outer membrane protein [Tenacibaculum halocynthiae]|uniref:Omp28-related outer membrane protein n=1 Tax=Tenacibaculum halocynthiae TaxID=1254437 RepID=UPI003D65B05F
MKTTKLFLSSIVCALTFTLFMACSASSDADPGNEETVKSVEIKKDKDGDIIFTGEVVKFTVIANGGINVTTSATIYVNGDKISGDSFKPTTAKAYEVKAIYKNVASKNKLNLTCEAKGATFQKNVVVEDYTGAWCGWCPRVSHALKLVSDKTSNMIPIAAHIGDNMENKYSKELAKAFDVKGYPTAYIDRAKLWSSPEPQNTAEILNLIKDNAVLGIKMESTLNGTDMNLKVSVKFGNTYAGKLKLTVFALEDGIVLSQKNYTSYYGGASDIADFKHNYILRHSFTSVLGDEIDSKETVKDNVYTKEFKGSVPSTIKDSSKMSFVAIVSNGDTKAAINSRSAKVSTSNNFEVK